MAGIGSALAACAASVAPAGEMIELSYMTPDRELANRVKEVQISGFNTAMEEAGQPYRVTNVLGPATDNDIKTKLTLDGCRSGNVARCLRLSP